MKKNILLFLLGMFTSTTLFSQINPRMLNPNYMWTSLFDTFNTLDRNKWKVADNSPFYGGFASQNLGFLLCWKDSTATIRVNNGDLLLSGIKYDNYTTTFNWFGNDTTVTTNFIAATMETYDYFHYGIFECSMTCDYKKGTFPAFWLYNDSQCSVSKRTEIDIMEFKYEDSSPEINHGFFYYPDCNDNNIEGPGHDQSAYNGGAHTYKCVYMPDKVEFYIDDTLKHTVTKNISNEYWYPDMQHHIILSHQLWRYNTTAPYFGIQYPQTTKFHWISAKTFFLAPEITVQPIIICTSGTTVLDVDPSADSITWSLTPTNLFSGAKTGTGKNASITAASGASGQVKITYTFKMPSNEIFTAEKTFWVGKPVINNISGPQNLPYGGNQIYTADVSGANGATYQWTVSPSLPLTSYGDNVEISFPSTNGDYVITLVVTGCGPSAPYYYYVATGENEINIIYPNPATDETTLSLASALPVNDLDDLQEWEYEIYTQNQSLKEKKTKLKGYTTKINTSGWKEGVYIVRVKYGKLVFQEKLIIER